MALACEFPLWHLVSGPRGRFGLSGIAQGRVIHPLLFNLLFDSFAATLRAAVPGVRLVDSDPCRHVCQLHADGLVILAESQAGLRVALDAVHAWSVRWRFSFGVGPTKSATMVFCSLRDRPYCCVHLGGVPLPLVPQHRYLGVVLSPTLSWRPRVDLSVLVGIASSTRPVLGALVIVCLFPSPRLCSSPTSSPALLSVWSSSVMILRLSSSSTSHSAVGVVIFVGGPLQLPSPQFTGNLVLVMHCGLPSDVPLSLFGRLCAMDLPSSRTPAWQYLPAQFHSAWYMVALVRVCPPLSFYPACWPRRHLTRFAILVGLSLVLTRSQCSPGPVTCATGSAMTYYLRGVLVDGLSDNFPFPVSDNPLYSFNLPPSALRLWGLASWGHDHTSTGGPSRHRHGPPPASFCHDADGSLAHHLSSCPHTTMGSILRRPAT